MLDARKDDGLRSLECFAWVGHTFSSSSFNPHASLLLVTNVSVAKRDHVRRIKSGKLAAFAPRPAPRPALPARVAAAEAVAAAAARAAHQP